MIFPVPDSDVPPHLSNGSRCYLLTISHPALVTVTTFKTLRVLFHEDMSWDDQIRKASTAISTLLCILQKVRRNLPESVKQLIYDRLFEFQLHFCFLERGRTTNANINKKLLQEKKHLVLYPMVDLMSIVKDY